MGAVTAALFAAVHLLFSKGILYCISSLVAHVYLRFARYRIGHRFNLYNYFAYDDPVKLSYFAPQQEYELDCPQNAVHLKKNRDSVFFMGVNSHSESLAVRISRKSNSLVHCSLVLRLSDGRTYILPEESRIQPEVDEPQTFGSSRLKLQCLSPMRRWRVFFNGILKETSSEGFPESKSVHVRFSFLWVASSGVFDYFNDMSTSLLVDAAASQVSWPLSSIRLLHRLRSIFNSYEQCGMLLGTVTLEGQPEKEVYLWGCRGHYLGRIAPTKDGDLQDIYVNSENGTFIHLGTLNLPGIIRNFTYGFVMRPNGFIFPIEKCDILEEDPMENWKKYRCFSKNKEYTIKVTKKDVSLMPDRVSSITYADALLNVMKGQSLIYECKIEPQLQLTPKKQKVLFTDKSSLPPTMIPRFTVPFDDPYCQLTEVSGGKGSSLAKLSVISYELKNFTVPKGIVVTTEAYQSFTEEKLYSSLQKFENDAWNFTKANIKAKCQSIVDEVSNTDLPESLKQSIETNLKKIFGPELENTKFAVRSSATGEDTAQMSAAGQMETFLGCNGLKEIFEALKKCWASQFSHIAVEYKRRYGQPLNTPMAVVIQQMVPCDAAGVIFTCDPVTGNPSCVSITANYGLGESVVAASADPDTVILERDELDAISFHSQFVGKKKSKIIMDDSSGTKEIHIEETESNEYCISRETSLILGEIAVKVEKIFGTPRDIEWGTLGGEIYLFQSRPVTSLDIETDFEIKHSFDSHMRREDEYSTTANLGEVLPGAISPLGSLLVFKTFDISVIRKKYTKWLQEPLPNAPYFYKRVVLAMNHSLYATSNGYFRFSETEGKELSNHTKMMTVALFGRLIEDKKIFDMAKDRHKDTEKSEISLIGKIYIMFIVFFAGYFVKKEARHLDHFHVRIKDSSSSDEILRQISHSFHKLSQSARIHIDATVSSAFWNNAILSLLAKVKGAWDNDVFSDFAYLLSTCSHVESADVPSSLQKLGFTIYRCVKPDEFKKMTTEDALEWLRTSPSEAGIRFRGFLAKHGHRCLKEFDVYSLTWELDPKPLVKMLQGLVAKDIKDPTKKGSVSFGRIVNNLSVQLGFFDRLKLRLLLPNSQRGVRGREASKSTLIKTYSKFRTAFRKMADAMVKEGRLPNQELLFFLDLEEIRQLIKTRSPRLVAKALRRWKLHPEMDRLIFPQIVSGIPRPINMEEDLEISETGFTMKGVPVSQGIVKGTARVVLSLDDANEIQTGDILITYATDIGWSPYFALLSGVATEIGGLISHGAVVAREYGLPCVVNLQGASRSFKSGDLVLLDGNRGILQKIEKL